MNFVFLMDPLETVKYEKDTSFILMLSSAKKGHNVFFLPQRGIYLKKDKLYFKVQRVIPQDNPEQPFLIKENLTLSEEETDVVFVRTEPPFDNAYLIDTWLLEKLPSHIPVINSATGIRTVNEKIWATSFTSIIPKTLVTCDQEQYLKFLAEEKDIIIKPTDGFGGASVFRVREGDSNIRVLFETLSKMGNKYLIIQKYIPEAKVGDKRIILLNGEPLGAVLRVHSSDDHRNNFFAGGKPVDTEITAREHEIIQILKPELKKLGLYFVGIDIIGDYLIEVNVTSPTCLQEMIRNSGERLDDRVIEFVENLKQSVSN